MRSLPWFLAIAVACGHSKTGLPVPTQTSADSDTDTDADSDTDTDLTADSADSGTPTGSDTATDTGVTTPTSVIDGEWVGSCAPPVSGPGASFDLDLRLTEAAGAVQGKGQLSDSTVVGSTGGTGSTTVTTVIPIVVQGTWDGVSLLELELGVDIGTVPYPLGFELSGPVVGTTWTPELSRTTYTTTTYPPLECTLDRI